MFTAEYRPGPAGTDGTWVALSDPADINTAPASRAAVAKAGDAAAAAIDGAELVLGSPGGAAGGTAGTDGMVTAAVSQPACYTEMTYWSTQRLADTPTAVAQVQLGAGLGNWAASITYKNTKSSRRQTGWSWTTGQAR